MEKVLKFKWTISRAQDTYGYNICSLYVDGKKVSACNGGGYDMTGTCLGDYIAGVFAKRLRRKIKEVHYGLTFHNPTYDPGQAKIDNETIEKREKGGKSFGLERYQAFYSASSKVPTKKHVVPSINGACGFSSVERVMKTIGLKLKFIDDTKNTSTYLLKGRGK